MSTNAGLELEIYKQALAVATRSLKHTEQHCLCARFKTKGFDYHEKHPRRPSNNGGSRPTEPGQASASALKEIESLMEKLK